MSITKEEITERVISVIMKVKPTIENFSKDMMSTSIIGYDIDCDYQELVFILLELSEEFKIKFVKEDVENGRFGSIDNIVEIICNKINI